MKLYLQKHRRIFLYFLLGIGLPCVLLSYFALRGIQNDRALTERNNTIQNRRLARKVVQDFKEHLHQVENACRNTLFEELPESDSLRILKSRHPSIEEIFQVSASGTIEFPIALLLYRPGAPEISRSQEFSNRQSKLVHEGQRYEFRDKSMARACAKYEKAFRQTNDSQLQGEILIAIARVRQKQSQWKDAIGIYTRLLDEYYFLESTSGYPFGTAAGIELTRILLSREGPVAAAPVLFRIYKSLTQAVWRLSADQFQFFHRKLEKLSFRINEAQNPAPRLQSWPDSLKTVKTILADRQRQTDRLLVLAAGLNNKVQNHATAERSPLMHQFNDNNYLVSLLKAPGTNGSSSAEVAWGILWDVNHLSTKLFQEIVGRYPTKDEIVWQIVNHESKVMNSSHESIDGEPVVMQFFGDRLPGWRLNIYKKPPEFLDYVLTSGRRVYFYIFLLITGILGFGFVLTVRSVRHELELSRLKSDFVSTVSHELKSPLTSIRQLSEMLQAGRVASTEKRQKYYDVIVEQSGRLSTVIENVLDFAKMEENKKRFEFEPVDLADLIADTVLPIQHQIQHDDFKIGVEIKDKLPLIDLDRSAMMQVLGNLIDNAIKYSRDSKKIQIRAYRETQIVGISVQDFGIGIEKDEIKKIFGRFYRGRESRSRMLRGTGLGLTLVSQIVKAHNGVLQVRSEPGKGSTFTVRLPIKV